MRTLARVIKVTKGDTVLKYMVEKMRVFPTYVWVESEDGETTDRIETLPDSPPANGYWEKVNRKFTSHAEAKAYAEWLMTPEVSVVV